MPWKCGTESNAGSSRLTGDYNATSIGGDDVVDTYKQGDKK